MSDPVVSVIVPVYNRAGEIHKCLDALSKQTYPAEAFEIIVIDDYSEDDLKGALKKYRKVKYVLNELEFSLPAARNMGLRVAKGDIIIFLDDDAIVDENYIEEIIKIFHEYENVGGVTGRLKNLKVQKVKKSFFGKIMLIYATVFGVSGFFVTLKGVGEILETGFISGNFEKIDRLTEVKWLSGCNMCYSKKAIQEVGLFDPEYMGHSYHEDSDFSFRIYKKGYKLYANPKALVEHLVLSVSRKKMSKLKYFQLIHNNRFFLKNVYGGSKLRYLRHLIAHWSLLLPVAVYSFKDRDLDLLVNYLKAEKVVLKRVISGVRQLQT